MLTLRLIESSAYAATYAFLVGVNQYKSPLIHSLQGAVNDVSNVNLLLTSAYGIPASNISILVDDRATKENVQCEFSRIAAKVTPVDTFIFYFSGHGAETKDKPPYDEADTFDEFLCLHDTERIPNREFVNILLDDELGEFLDNIRCNKFVILDACHSGTAAKAFNPAAVANLKGCVAKRIDFNKVEGQPNPKAPFRFDESTADIGHDLSENNSKQVRSAHGNGRQLVLSACRADQIAIELCPSPGSDIRSGAMTTYLLKALAGAAHGAGADRNGDGEVTFRELEQYLSRELTQIGLAQPNNSFQRPVLESSPPEAADDPVIWSKPTAIPASVSKIDGASIELRIGDKHYNQLLGSILGMQKGEKLAIYERQQSGDLFALGRIEINTVSKEAVAARVEKPLNPVLASIVAVPILAPRPLNLGGAIGKKSLGLQIKAGSIPLPQKKVFRHTGERVAVNVTSSQKARLFVIAIDPSGSEQLWSPKLTTTGQMGEYNEYITLQENEPGGFTRPASLPFQGSVGSWQILAIAVEEHAAIRHLSDGVPTREALAKLPNDCWDIKEFSIEIR